MDAAIIMIGTLNESPLHAALKRQIAQPGDQLEVRIDGYFIDILRGDLLIEIQTRHFSAIKTKLAQLVVSHCVRLAHPIAQTNWIVRFDPATGEILGRRKSPRRGGWHDIFAELRFLPAALVTSPNFELEALLTHTDEIRVHDPQRGGWRRRGWVTQERRLIDIIDRRVFHSVSDLGALLPDGLAEPFDTAALAAAIARPRRLAQQMAYCLREIGAIAAVGKRGSAILYERRE